MRLYYSFISETPQGIESLGEITTQERRPTARGGVWLRSIAEHGQPVVPQWITIPLPCASPNVELVRETSVGGF